MQSENGIDRTRTIRVAAVQMVSENGRVTNNLSHATPLIEQAKQEGAQLVLLPEFMPTGYFWGEDIWESSELSGGPTVTWLKQNSKRLSIWLGTSFLEADGNNFFNTFVLTDPLGEVVGRIRKQNPALYEAYFFRGEIGTHFIDTSLGKIGVSICFDSQLANITAILSKQSVDLVLMPHCYPMPATSSRMFNKEKEVGYFQMITSIYATLLGVPIVLANKCGLWESPIPGLQFVKQTGGSFPGLSNIVDSDGTVKAILGDEEGVIVTDVTIDPALKKHPVVPHYGRYIHPGYRHPQRAIIRLIESMGRLSYEFSTRRKNKARAVSLQS
jgi:N-carbamoylputrescine amidase